MKHQILILVLFALVLVALIISTHVILCREKVDDVPVTESLEDDITSDEKSVEEVIEAVKEVIITRNALTLEERERIRDIKLQFVYESLFKDDGVSDEPVNEQSDEVKEPDAVRYTLEYTGKNFYFYTGYYKYGEWYKMPMPEKYQKMVYKYCEAYDVPYELALAVSGVETSFDAERGVVVGRNGHAYFGPGMVNKYYYEKRTGKTLSTPEDGVIAMVETIARKLEEFDGNFHHALMAYNYGSGYTRGKIANGQHSSKYSNRVLEIYNGLLQHKKENP